MTKGLMTAREFAQHMGVSKGTVDRWCHTGKITPIRTQGGHKRFSVLHLAEATATRQPRRPSPNARAWAADAVARGKGS